MAQESRKHPTESRSPVDTEKHYEVSQERAFKPVVDIYESEDALILFADMPGVTEDSVELSLHEGELVLTGYVNQPPPGREPVHTEYEVGHFHRHFDVYGIDEERAKATMEDGVLKVVLPKREQHKPRKIVVE